MGNSGSDFADGAAASGPARGGFFAQCSRCLAPAPSDSAPFNTWALLRGNPDVKAEFVCPGCLTRGDDARITQGVSNAMIRLQQVQDDESERRRLTES